MLRRRTQAKPLISEPTGKTQSRLFLWPAGAPTCGRAAVSCKPLNKGGIRAYSVASRSDTPPSLRLGPAERAAALRLGSPCSRDSAWSAPLPLQQGNALHSSVPQLVWHLASILRKLLHDLLMQPDVHRGRIAGVA
jgi:hypothetical protein